MEKLDLSAEKVILEGSIVGELVVGQLVDLDDPRVVIVPRGYLAHGRLRLCFCSCGRDVIYSEFMLKREKVKSCGHIRYAKTIRKAQKDKLRKQLKDLNGRISILTAHYTNARNLGNTKLEGELMETLLDLHNQARSLRLQIKSP